jgi:hypothetical protein
MNPKHVRIERHASVLERSGVAQYFAVALARKRQRAFSVFAAFVYSRNPNAVFQAHEHWELYSTQHMVPLEQPISSGASIQNTPLAAGAGADATVISAPQSTTKLKSLRVSRFSIMSPSL